MPEYSSTASENGTRSALAQCLGVNTASQVGSMLHTSTLRRVSPLSVAAADSLPILRVLILSLICILAFSVRLFAVIRYESVIHEFDPYFNFRTTRFLAKNGFEEWWNWFDPAAWYPLGRVVGQTLYPGLMMTAFLMHKILAFFGCLVDIKDVCVFTAPIFSAFTALAVYGFVKEMTGQARYALFSSVFLALSPAYMSRSVAGSYDNEAVAIFALIFAFYAYLRAINRGTSLSATLASLAYFYMAASWGGYVFITNVIAIHALVLILLNRVTLSHYVVYSIFHVTGTLFCLNIPFVNFQAVRSSEHMASHCVFFLVQMVFLSQALRSYIPARLGLMARNTLLAVSCGGTVIVALWLSITGRTQWAGRSLTLLDPTYASKYIPIIASVSEHQPPNWTNYIFDLHICLFFAAAGLWLVFTYATDTSLFGGLYGILSVYFSCVMVRLMLVLSPAFCALAGIGLSYTLSCFVSVNGRALSDELDPPVFGKIPISNNNAKSETQSSDTKKKSGLGYFLVPCIAITILLFMCFAYVKHSVMASAVAYSHPSIVQNYILNDGSRFIQDDFREAYYWMRKNTHKDARLMSWWDYGYQSAAMADRTVIVDNNTWNTTHIATVGLAFASPEEEAYPILLKLDVDYVFLVFGGYAQYSGDDINKFLWMVRIAEGPYPWVNERLYLTSGGYYSVGADAAPAMKNSLLYRLSYHRFDEVSPGGYDPVRQQSVPKVAPLKYLEEVYTTDNWIVRIYKVKRPDVFHLNATVDASFTTPT